MALNSDEIALTARCLADVIFVKSNTTAHSDLDTLKALVQALDNAMESAPTTLPQQASPLQANLNQIGVAAAPNSTLQERLIAVQLWAAKKAGII